MKRESGPVTARCHYPNPGSWVHSETIPGRQAIAAALFAAAERESVVLAQQTGRVAGPPRRNACKFISPGSSYHAGAFSSVEISEGRCVAVAMPVPAADRSPCRPRQRLKPLAADMQAKGPPQVGDSLVADLSEVTAKILNAPAKRQAARRSVPTAGRQREPAMAVAVCNVFGTIAL